MRCPHRIGLRFVFLAVIWTDPSIGQQLQIPANAELGCGLSARDVDAGWISLFDGSTLFGWQAESDANWRVEDGCIVVDRGSTPGLLHTTAQFDDYDLQLEFQATDETNSGVFVRTSPRPTDPAADCIEINIAPRSNPFPTGSIVSRVNSAEAIGGDDWHRMSITVRGGSIDVSVDDRRTSRLDDAFPTGRGFVGLQFNSGLVRFRNLRLKPVGLHSMFDGKSLQGWIPYDQFPARFSVSDPGTLRAQGGPGQLESVEPFADFVLQFKCRTGGEGVNSGVFVRCIPGDQMNGYEVQIDNSTVDGDRNQPKNAGTGAIMHRSEARRVVANDGEWCAVTLVAVGPRFSTWVNGFQVTDWKDVRDKHKNPRNGLRLEPGSIMLQAHDAATAIWFSNLNIRELSARHKSLSDGALK